MFEKFNSDYEYDQKEEIDKKSSEIFINRNDSLNENKKMKEKLCYFEFFNGLKTDLEKRFTKRNLSNGKIIKKKKNSHLIRSISNPLDYESGLFSTNDAKIKKKMINKNLNEFEPFLTEVSQIILKKREKKLNFHEESFYEFPSMLN